MLLHESPLRRMINRIPERLRSDATNLFLRAHRSGIDDPAAICREVWRAVTARQADADASGWPLGGGTIRAADLTAMMREHREEALDFALWCIEWDRLSSVEKERQKAIFRSRTFWGAR